MNSSENTITINFNYQFDYKDRPFFQPLFYIGSNLRQFVACSKDYNPDMHDKRFDFTGDSINLEISQVLAEKKKITEKSKIDISYMFNRFTNKFKFNYDEKLFVIKSIDNSKKQVFPAEHGTQIEIYSSYQIIINKDDMATFETFICESMKYYSKFYNEDLDRNKRREYIKIYIGNPEGFFERMGRRYKRSLDTVYLPTKQKKDIVDDITKFLKEETRERYMKLGINYKKTYLLEGIPGAGKSSLIMALASHFDYNLAIVSFHPKMTDNDLMRLLRSIDTEDEDKRSFIVFEDMDCIFKERKCNDENKNAITFSGLLNTLDGITTSENQICFITTNYKHHLDSALIRPGRVDYIYKFDYAVKEQIVDIFKVYTGSEERANEFYNDLCKFNIKISTSLLQQYLLKYLDDPVKAIDNLDELKRMFDSCNISKEAEDSGMYS